MALEAVVFPPFRSELLCNDLPVLEDPGFLPCPFVPDWTTQFQSTTSTLALQLYELSSIDNAEVRRGWGDGDSGGGGGGGTTLSSSRPKRRRPKSSKNKEDIESQRMTHIAVERNRRKQMNEHLASLRSLMPEPYCQRVDQASIIGSAINFVKELEYKIHLLDARRHPPVPKSSYNSPSDQHESARKERRFFLVEKSSTDIETSMVESHANLKIRSRRRPRQLLILITGLQALRLTVLHLNIHTFDQIVDYLISVKVEDSCKLKSADEISSAVYQIFLLNLNS